MEEVCSLHGGQDGRGKTGEEEEERKNQEGGKHYGLGINFQPIMSLRDIHSHCNYYSSQMDESLAPS